MNFKANKNLWIVTDLDGTLMDHNYDISPAIETIKWLKDNRIPIIPCTSKTASEVRYFREENELTDPFIVENGGAAYYLSDSREIEIPIGKSTNDLFSIFDKISDDIGYKLRPLSHLNCNEIQSLTGLKGEFITRAIDRKWSIPFLNPPESVKHKLSFISSKYDVCIFQGNLMSHMLSQSSNKGKAISILKNRLGKNNVKVLALGDSHNDIPLLDAADYSIVIPGKNGANKSLIKGIKNGSYHLSPYAHAKGWSYSVRKYINSIDNNI